MKAQIQNSVGSPRRAAFTLIEVLGVVAVLVVLCAILVPAVGSYIEEARLSADVQSLKNIQSAAQTYYLTYGKFAGVAGGAVTWTNSASEYWDCSVLLGERLVERPFALKLATQSYVRLTLGNTATTTDPLGWATVGSLGNQLCNNGAYDLTQAYTADNRPGDAQRMYALGGPPRCSSLGRWVFPVAARASRTLTLSVLSQAGSLTMLWRAPGFVAALARRLPDAKLAFLSDRERWFGFQRVGFRRHLQTGVLRFLGKRWGHGYGPLEASVKLVPHSPINAPCPPAGDTSPAAGGTSSPTHASSPPTHNDATGSVVVEAVLQGVTIADAYRLSMRIDGPAQSNWAYWDSQGRVKYNFAGNTVGTVFIYLCNK